MQQQSLPRRQRSRSLHTNKLSQIILPPQLYKFKKNITQIMSKTPINQNPSSNNSINTTIRHVGNGSSSSSPSTTSQACAACKYQRRKCAPDCILAPYFPHHRQRQFQNAHKLFGVSNITKILKTLDPFQKEEAMRTIIFQSDVRATDPVGGCYRIIRDLQRQIDYSNAELDIVLHQLAICKSQAQQQEQNDHLHPHDHEEEDHSHVLSQQYHQYLQQQQQHPFQPEPYVQIDQNHDHDQIVHHDLQEDLSSFWRMQQSLQSSSSISSTTLHAKESLLPAACSSIEGYELDHPPPPPPPPHHDQQKELALHERSEGSSSITKSR